MNSFRVALEGMKTAHSAKHCEYISSIRGQLSPLPLYHHSNRCYSHRYRGRKDNMRSHWKSAHEGKVMPEWPEWHSVISQLKANKKSTITSKIDAYGVEASAGYTTGTTEEASTSVHAQTTPNLWAPIEPMARVTYTSVPNPSQQDCIRWLNEFQDSFPLPDGTLPLQGSGTGDGTPSFNQNGDYTYEHTPYYHISGNIWF
jgi:hypothetical protein